MVKHKTAGIIVTCVMAVMILDSKTAIAGAQEGIKLCIETIVPSLFPFMILSGIINSFLLGYSPRLLRPISRLCKVPEGAESLFLLGFIGGYPIGAQNIAQAYKTGALSESSAKRMIGFCNNAGPSFMFGILSAIFSRPIILWSLWIIHISTAIIVGCLLPSTDSMLCKISKTKPLTMQKALNNAIKTIAIISGWVIIFRIIIVFCNKWFLRFCPPLLQILFSGMLELSNGCILLKNIDSESLRFIYASCFLAFGGICVGMQTTSVTQELDCSNYFLGKILHTLLSLIFAIVVQPILFSSCNHDSISFKFSVFIIVIIFTIYLIFGKKLWQLWKTYSIMFAKKEQKGQTYAISKKNRTVLQLLSTRHRNG